jgi:hypothetical protein
MLNFEHRKNAIRNVTSLRTEKKSLQLIEAM